MQAMYRCRSDYGLMPLGMLLTRSALLNLYLIGLNYYGNTIEVLFCKNSVCDVHLFYVPEFSSLLQMFEHLHRNLGALDEEQNVVWAIPQPLSISRLVQLHEKVGRFQLHQN